MGIDRLSVNTDLNKMDNYEETDTNDNVMKGHKKQQERIRHVWFHHSHVLRGSCFYGTYRKYQDYVIAGYVKTHCLTNVFNDEEYNYNVTCKQMYIYTCGLYVLPWCANPIEAVSIHHVHDATADSSKYDIIILHDITYVVWHNEPMHGSNSDLQKKKIPGAFHVFYIIVLWYLRIRTKCWGVENGSPASRRSKVPAVRRMEDQRCQKIEV